MILSYYAGLYSYTYNTLCTKFEVPSSSSFEDMFNRMPKI